MILKKNKKGRIIVFTKDQLVQLIKRTIDENGSNCDLNFIDISRITDLSYLFSRYYGLSSFNGDISKWDTRSVINMSGMFYASEFNGDISKWNTKNVTDMPGMFRCSNFNGDISRWDVSGVQDMTRMFSYSLFSGDLSRWKPIPSAIKIDMFIGSLAQKNLPGWFKNVVEKI